MKITKFISLLLFISHLIQAQPRKLELEDVFAGTLFYAKTISGFRPLGDGLRYANTNEQNDILAYEYETGKVTDTLARASMLLTGDADVLAYDGYELSDDASQILFSAETERIYRHSTRSEFYVYNRLSKKLIRVSDKGKQMHATLSPDGHKAAFVRDNNLFIKNLVQGTETQVTFDGRPNEIINGSTDWVYEEEFSFDRAYEWSPDGRYVAFYKFDESRVREYTLPNYIDGPYPDQKTYKYPKAGEDNSVVSIFVYELAGARTVKMETGSERDQYIPRIHWSADPKKLCVMRMNRHQNNLELLLCDAAVGGSSVFYTETSKYYIDIEINDKLQFTGDNKHFLWLKPENGFTHLGLYTMAGKLERQITSGPWDVTAFYGYNEKTRTAYFQAAVKSPLERQIFSVGSDGSRKVLSKTSGTNDAQFNSDFRYFINTWSDANTPYRCAVYSSSLGKEVRLLEDNAEVRGNMDAYSLQKKTFFSFTTSEGVVLNGWMIKPAGFDASRKYPVFQYMYGGPGAQTVNEKWEGANYFYWQLLAQQGVVVVSVDNRGTGARGEEFQKCTFLNLGKLEVVDQLETAKYLAALPFVDKERIAVFGWSYGGYLVSLLMTKGAGTFKAGIAVAPVTSWRYYDTIYTERYLHTPQENAAGYDDNSPINFAATLQGKFLLVHGLYDDNVHFQNSALFVNALVKENKQFETFFYPNKNHSLPGARLHLFSKMTEFLNQNL